MAKNDSALLEKIDKIFACAGNSASIAESYIVILKMAIGRYNENPNTEKLFDGSAIVNTEDAYSEIFGTKPKLSAEKAKEEKEAMDAQKAKFDNMYQYTYAIINRRYVELHNEQSERDLNALKSLKNSYDFCFSKGQYNLCKTLNNIASYIGMTTSEMVEKQGCFFTKEILNDLKLINSNIQIAINVSKQRTQQNLDESKEKSI